MPAPSIIPLVNAAALALAIVCITLSWVLVIFFGIIFLISTIKWVGDTRRDIAALPLDHSSH
jgi:TRAP-type C4-dicarboxylate transport system permease small subunit